jgi:hypothetical protein
MSQDRLPPPGEQACLVRLRSSTQKGGTIVAEDVTDLVTHERRLCDPDGYRPKFCPKCGATILHVHDYRLRALWGEPGQPATRVVRHECVICGAIWQILPAFIARHLWRTWRVVEHTLMGSTPLAAGAETRRWPVVPERTRRRWCARWQRPARYLIGVLASSGEAAWGAVLRAEATCADLVAAYAARGLAAAGHLLAAVAALIYRLQPKVRLM